jgi:nitroreductase
MDFYEVVRKRRSYRVYKSDMPEVEKINKILEAARLAPTWANMQGVNYIIVREPKNVENLWKAIEQNAKFTEAPMFIVAVINEKDSGVGPNGIKYFPVDVGICFEHLILAATAEGLATCWIGFFNEEKVREVLEIPKKYRVLAITPLGYPIREKEEITERKPLEQIIHYEKF